MTNYFSWTQQSYILAVWTAPRAPETTPKGGALRAPPFGVVSGAHGAVQTPKIDDFWVPEKSVFMIILIRSMGLLQYGSGRRAEVLGRPWLPISALHRVGPGLKSRLERF